MRAGSAAEEQGMGARNMLKKGLVVTVLRAAALSVLAFAGTGCMLWSEVPAGAPEMAFTSKVESSDTPLIALARSSKSPVIAGLTGQGKVVLLDAAGIGRASTPIDAGRPAAIAVDQSGALFAAVDEKGATVWDLATGRRLASLAMRVRLTSVVFQPSLREPDKAERAVLLGGSDGRAYRWKYLAEPRPFHPVLERYIGAASVVSAVAYHPFGRVFFTGDWSGSIQAWLGYDTDRFEGEYDRSFFGGKLFTDRSIRVNAARDADPVAGLSVSKDGERLYVVSQSGLIEVWSVRGFKKLAGLKAHEGLVTAMTLAPDGVRLATAGRDGKVRISVVKEVAPTSDNVFQVRAEPYKIESIWSEDQYGVTSLAFNAEGRLLVGSRDVPVRELDVPRAP